MLPTLGRKSNLSSNINISSNNTQFQASQIKLYNPPKELVSMQQFQSQRKNSMNVNSASKQQQPHKIRAAGFKKSQQNNSETHIKRQSIIIGKNQHNQNAVNYSTSMNVAHNVKQFNMKQTNVKDLSAEIKLIEKKIRYHKKKLQQDKKKKQQDQKAKNNPYSKDFQKIIQREMDMQKYNQIHEEIDKGFDYLTNPNKANQQPQPQPQQQAQPIVNDKKFNIQEKVQKLEKHYQNNLRKKFERRQMFPHFACKRKTPKLYITTQTNTLEKFGKRPNKQEHIFRVMTKECTPQEIYPTIPQFSVVKDNLARNVLAYLGDYKPFLEKTKEDELFMGQDYIQNQIQKNYDQNSRNDHKNQSKINVNEDNNA